MMQSIYMVTFTVLDSQGDVLDEITTPFFSVKEFLTPLTIMSASCPTESEIMQKLANSKQKGGVVIHSFEDQTENTLSIVKVLVL